jgi:hypothetical protein
MGIGALIAWVWLPDVQNAREEGIKTSASPEDGNALLNGGDVNRVDSEVNQGLEDGIVGGEREVAGGGNQAANAAEKNQKTRNKWMEKYIVPNKSLEELAEGWQAMVDEGQVLSLRRNLGIYEVTLPFVEMVQGWFSKKEEVKEE